MSHPLESLMRTTMESLKSMVDVNTVVGDAVETKDGTVIVPVSRVTFGFVAGGGDEIPGEGIHGNMQSQGGDDSLQQENLPFTGGSGAGVSVKPVGFLVVGEGKVRFLPVDSRAIYDRLLEAAPDLLDRFADIMDRRVTAQGGETEILEPLH
jgi:sporulation protein YtfJ